MPLLQIVACFSYEDQVKRFAIRQPFRACENVVMTRKMPKASDNGSRLHINCISAQECYAISIFLPMQERECLQKRI
jgi:hypothetical protein